MPEGAPPEIVELTLGYYEPDGDVDYPVDVGLANHLGGWDGAPVTERYLVAIEEQSDIAETRDILAVVDPEPLVPPDLLHLARWVSSYYGCALGEAIQAMLPGGVRRPRPRTKVVVRTGVGELPARARKAAAIFEALARFERPPAVKRLLDAAGTTRDKAVLDDRAGSTASE